MLKKKNYKYKILITLCQLNAYTCTIIKFVGEMIHLLDNSRHISVKTLVKSQDIKFHWFRWHLQVFWIHAVRAWVDTNLSGRYQDRDKNNSVIFYIYLKHFNRVKESSIERSKILTVMHKESFKRILDRSTSGTVPYSKSHLYIIKMISFLKKKKTNQVYRIFLWFFFLKGWKFVKQRLEN